MQLIFLLRFSCGATPALQGHHLPIARVAASALVWECVVLFTYLFNGAMDTVEDQVNSSRRPIACGLLRPATAHWMAATAAIAALTMGFELGRTLGLLASAALVLGYLYSGPPWYLKRGTFTSGGTGILGSLLTYAAGLAAGGGMLFTSQLAYFALAMSLWTGLVGSLTKDLPDLAGDAAAGRRTAAVIVGEARVRLAASVVAAMVALTFLAIAMSLDLSIILPAIALACGAAVLDVVCLPKFSAGDFSLRRRPYQVFMATQYAAHLSFIAVVAYRLL